MAIQSFADENTADFWRGKESVFSPDIRQRTKQKLLMLDAATDPRKDFPGESHLEKIKVGHCAGRWSIRINDRWRICFEWRDVNAHEVEVTDHYGD